MEENQDKKECPKKECPEFPGFHGFGPRCHGRFGFPPMWGMPPCGPCGPAGPHKHKERKCECGEVIPKRKPGEPKIKECPKCKKALPKKCHGFGMRCHKMKKFMKFMKMMQMCGGMYGFGPERFCPPPMHPFGTTTYGKTTIFRTWANGYGQTTILWASWTNVSTPYGQTTMR